MDPLDHQLHNYLSADEEPPYNVALSAGAIPALITALQPPVVDATALEVLFEAAWALSNLAVGEAEVVKAVVGAAPILIAYVGGGSGIAVAEQCAWALGNIAGEDAEYREVLIANGAIPPLAGLLIGAAKAAASSGNSETDPAVTAGATAAWALANLLRGSGREVGQFMAVEGAPEALVRIMQSAPANLASESAWILAYLTTGAEANLNRIVLLGLLPPLATRVVAAVDRMLAEGQGAAARSELTPLLRTLGNIIAGGGAGAAQEILSPECADALRSVVLCAESRHHGLQREAAWALGNVAGLPGRGGINALRSLHAIPVLMALLKEQPFHVRKEAAFALANIVAGGGGGTGDSEAMNWLFGADVDAVRAMLTLLRSADTDAVRLGLQFVEMLLRLLPSGVQVVQAADGIDALEAVQFGRAPEEMQRAAAALVDRYWSVGMEEDQKGS